MPPPKPPHPLHGHPHPPKPPHKHPKPHHPPPREQSNFPLSKPLLSSLFIALGATAIFAGILYFFKIKIEVILPTSAPIFVGVLTILYNFLKEK